MNAKCYRKFYGSSRLSWFSASNQCLTRGGSLAVFSDIGRPSDNSQLINWLNTSTKNNSYWIGLVRSWWKTDDKGIFRCASSFSAEMYVDNSLSSVMATCGLHQITQTTRVKVSHS